jgi:hypothetical protein
MDLRPIRVVALAIPLLLLAAAAASAGEHTKVRLTKAGMAAARAPQIKEADLPPIGGWTGHADPTGRTSETACSVLHPKESDIVVIGDAGAQWAHTGLQIWSGAQVLRTPHMVALDWQRKIATPQFLPCLRESAHRSQGAGWHFVSLKRLPFPQIGTRTAAYRALYDVDKAVERLMVDVIFYGHGRTELTLTTIAPVSAATQLKPIQVRVAQELDTRIRT